MKQFLLPPDFDGQHRFELTGKDYHYLCRVRRVKVGAEFPGVDRSGNRFLLRVTDITERVCAVEVRVLDSSDPDSSLDITLFQCLPRGTKMDLIVRQATEAGVSRIFPVLSRYSVPKIDVERQANRRTRVDRWTRIAREAVQQSGAAHVPDVSPPIAFEQILHYFEPDDENLGLFFHQAPLEHRTLHGYLGARPHRIAMVIGPEGGLSAEEIALLRDHGFAPVYLGSQVLRAETAAIYAIAAVQIVLLEKESWQIVQE